MYGLVNKAIEDLVSVEYGAEVWRVIAEKAGVDDAGFLSMEPYPDEITYRLVAAAAEVVELSAAELLEAFGEFWILYTAREGYGELLELSGETFAEFLENLDNLHSRVGLSFPGLRPPTFSCERQGPDRYRLHYHSERDGLAPMVRGLLKGLARKFEVGASIRHVQQRGADSDHDVFEIALEPRHAA